MTEAIDFDQVRRALDQKELFLEYLPLMRLDGSGCVGAEALVRWRRDGVVVPPMDFIPVIENTPLSGLLTYWVMDTVASELGTWLRTHDHVHLSINVPPEVLGRGCLAYAAQKNDLVQVRNRLVLEITERGAPDRMGLQEIRMIAAENVLIALDDVGLDDSNLLVLSRAPVDIVKIDKAVIEHITEPTMEGPLARLKSLIEASDRPQVVAEGIERADQAQRLRAAGVQMGQGFFYARPMPATQFIAWHAEHAAPAV